MSMLRNLIATNSDPSTRLLCITLGVIVLPHGAQKLFGAFEGPGIEGWIGFAGSLGVPPILAWLVMIVEVFGSIALILGVLGRIVALGILVDQVFAIFLVHLNNGFFVNNGGFEFNLLLVIVALTVVIRGSGPLSIDEALEGRVTAQ